MLNAHLLDTAFLTLGTGKRPAESMTPSGSMPSTSKRSRTQSNVSKDVLPRPSLSAPSRSGSSGRVKQTSELDDDFRRSVEFW